MKAGRGGCCTRRGRRRIPEPRAVTQGWLLGGKVRHDQAAGGFRSGIEPVLLAASVPARPGSIIIEGGSGAGAGLLCLTARVPGVLGLGVERDADQVAIAHRNARLGNASALFIVGDVLAMPLAPGAADHAFANPPYHDQASGPGSPDAARRLAKAARAGLIRDWMLALARAVRHRGTVTLCIPAAHLGECFAGFAEAGAGSAVIFPIWPADGRDARLVLLRTVVGGKAATRIGAGLVLHDACGFSPAAHAILWKGAALDLGQV